MADFYKPTAKEYPTQEEAQAALDWLLDDVREDAVERGKLACDILAGALQRAGYYDCVNLNWGDVAQSLVDAFGLSEAEAEKRAKSLSGEDLQRIAREINSNDAFMDGYWLTMEAVIQNDFPELVA